MKMVTKSSRCRRILGSALGACTGAGLPAVLCLLVGTLQCGSGRSASTGSADSDVDAESPTTTALKQLNAKPDAPAVRDALRTMHSSHEAKASLSSALSLQGSRSSSHEYWARVATARTPVGRQRQAARAIPRGINAIVLVTDAGVACSKCIGPSGIIPSLIGF
jgi:hypothetical protein